MDGQLPVSLVLHSRHVLCIAYGGTILIKNA